MAALGGAGACGRGAASEIILYKSYFGAIKANTALYRVKCLRPKEYSFVVLRSEKLVVLCEDKTSARCSAFENMPIAFLLTTQK